MTRTVGRMLDDHCEGGLSLDLQLRPPSGAAVGPLKPTLDGAVMVQHQPLLTLVNDEVNICQRPVTNGVLEFLGGCPTAPVDPPAAAANGMMQNQSTLTSVNGIVNESQRPTMNRVLGLMSIRAPIITAPVNRPPANANAAVVAEASPRGRKRPPPQPNHQSVEKSPIIPPPYPWSTDRRAKVYSIHTLLTRGITFISGEVQCRHCEQTSELKFHLVNKFSQIWKFVYINRVEMHERAPQKWLHPNFPTCSNCDHENSLKPIIADKKRNINWLFLLLGEMVGCCSLEQLKYFCKHTDNHRTGAKNRVLYHTYLTLCRQLNPDSPFKR